MYGWALADLDTHCGRCRLLVANTAYPIVHDSSDALTPYKFLLDFAWKEAFSVLPSSQQKSEIIPSQTIQIAFIFRRKAQVLSLSIPKRERRRGDQKVLYNLNIHQLPAVIEETSLSLKAFI